MGQPSVCLRAQLGRMPGLYRFCPPVIRTFRSKWPGSRQGHGPERPRRFVDSGRARPLGEQRVWESLSGSSARYAAGGRADSNQPYPFSSSSRASSLPPDFTMRPPEKQHGHNPASHSQQALIVGDHDHGALGAAQDVDALGYYLKRVNIRPESVSSRIASLGSRTIICRISLRLLFAARRKPSFD